MTLDVSLTPALLLMAKTSSAAGDSSRDQKLSRKTELVECGYETRQELDGAACDSVPRRCTEDLLQEGLEMTVLCDVTPCSFTGTYKRFVTNCHLHIRGTLTPRIESQYIYHIMLRILE